MKGSKLDFIQIRAFQVQRHYQRDIPDGPVVKNPHSNAGDVGSIPGQEAKISHASRPKTQNVWQKPHYNKLNKDL